MKSSNKLKSPRYIALTAIAAVVGSLAGTAGAQVVVVANGQTLEADNPSPATVSGSSVTVEEGGIVRATSTGSALRIVSLGTDGVYEAVNSGLIEVENGHGIFSAPQAVVINPGIIIPNKSALPVDMLNTATGKIHVNNGSGINTTGSVVNNGEVKVTTGVGLRKYNVFADAKLSNGVFNNGLVEVGQGIGAESAAGAVNSGTINITTSGIGIRTFTNGNAENLSTGIINVKTGTGIQAGVNAFNFGKIDIDSDGVGMDVYNIGASNGEIHIGGDGVGINATYAGNDVLGKVVIDGRGTGLQSSQQTGNSGLVDVQSGMGLFSGNYAENQANGTVLVGTNRTTGSQIGILATAAINRGEVTVQQAVPGGAVVFAGTDTALVNDSLNNGTVGIAGGAGALNDATGNVTVNGDLATGMIAGFVPSAKVEAVNQGLLNVTGPNSRGVVAFSSPLGEVTFVNEATGTITTNGLNTAGVVILGNDLSSPESKVGAVKVNVANSGAISSTGTSATGLKVSLLSDASEAVINNAGSLTASGADSVGVYLNPSANASAAYNGSTVVFDNVASGSISGDAFALRSDYGNVDFFNAGQVNGHVLLGTGNDRVTLAAGSVTGNVATGAGNDIFAMIGGTFTGNLAMGAGDDLAVFSNVDTNTIPTLDGGDGTNALIFENVQRAGGSDLTNWNTVNLTNRSNLTLNSNLVLAGPGADQQLNIDSTSVVGGNGQRTISSASGTLTVNNAGMIDMSGANPNILSPLALSTAAAGDRLIIAGNYVGNNGNIALDTVMGGTGSPTDRVLIGGDASGTTTLHINNVGGAGDGTGYGSTDGISVVQVAGAAAPGSFALAGGYVAAGPYQYVLRTFTPGDAATTERDPLLAGSGDFYDFRLQSAVAGALTPVPQISLYQAILPSVVMMGTEMIDTMHQRIGEIRHAVGSQSVWDKQIFVRARASQYEFDGKKGPDFRQNNMLLQVGATPLRTTTAGGGELHAGGGLAFNQSTIKVPSVQASGEVTMPTVSGLVSYLHPSGWYVDGVLQASAIRAKFKTAARGDVGSTNGYGFGASVEGGYNIALSGNLRLEPQAQLQYQYQHLKGFTDVDQIRVGKIGGSSLVGRLGARLMFDSKDTAGRIMTPYLEANVLHQLAGTSNVVNASGVDFAGDKIGTMAQYGAGVSAQFDKNVNFYLQARYTHEIGSRGHSGWGGTLGVRANFE